MKTKKVKTISALIAVAAGLGAAVAAQSGAAAVSGPTHTPEVQFRAAWDGVQPETLLHPSALQLPIRLENKEAREVVVRLDVRTDQDGTLTQHSLPEVALPASGQRTVRVPLQLPGVTNLQFSGKLIVEASARLAGARGETTLTLPHLYYHPTDAGVRFYGEDALRSKYGAGNFRGVSLDLQAAVREFGRAAIDARLPSGTEPAIARVSRANTFGNPNGPTHGAGRRFCMVMPGEAFNDSSNRVWIGPTGGAASKDYGEDYGRAGQFIPMTRVWVSVAQAGAPLYSGFMDAAGCTPELTAAPNFPTLIAFSPLYLHTARNIRGFVSDANLGTGPASMPLFFLWFMSGNTPTTNVVANSSEYAQTIYAAAAQGMERFHGGSENVLYEWRLRVQGDNAGTATTYAAEGHPRIMVKYSTAAQSKFTLLHEYGHAILAARANPPLSPSDVDYTVEPGEAEWTHTMTSKEWQLIGALEGFAHMVAAVAWNNTAAGSDGVYVDGSNVNPNLNAAWDLNTFGQYFLANYNPAAYPGQGVELDWAQFFWNYYTDTPWLPGVPPPSQSALVSIFMAAQPWPVNGGFFDAFSSAAAGVLPGTMPIPGPQAQQWFTMMAAFAGIIN